MQTLRPAVLAVVIAVALAVPAAVLGAAAGVELPGWMQRMMNDAPPEMERMMRSPEMERMMRGAGMGPPVMEPYVVDAMRSAGMQAGCKPRQGSCTRRRLAEPPSMARRQAVRG